jgi:hypothetical protein
MLLYLESKIFKTEIKSVFRFGFSISFRKDMSFECPGAL